LIFGDTVLKRIFGPKGNYVAGGWRNLYDKKLSNLYFRVIEAISMRLAGCVARTGEMKNHTKFLSKKRNDHLIDVCIDGRMNVAYFKIL
jgi:hypothetical protein